MLPAAAALEIEVDAAIDLAALAREPGVKSVRQIDHRLVLDVDDLAQTSATVLSWLARQGARVSRLSSERADLEAVFLALTGHKIRD
jgi:hypothetical protein